MKVTKSGLELISAEGSVEAGKKEYSQVKIGEVCSFGCKEMECGVMSMEWILARIAGVSRCSRICMRQYVYIYNVG